MLADGFACPANAQTLHLRGAEILVGGKGVEGLGIVFGKGLREVRPSYDLTGTDPTCS